MRGESEHGEGGFLAFGDALSKAVGFAHFARDVAITTESPIEAIFGIAAAREFPERIKSHLPAAVFSRCREGQISEFSSDYILMIPQYRWRRYRVDWAFHCGAIKQPWVFVECDGRDFHSSDEQIMRDAKRDLEMKGAGIPVLRFSGSDIHRHPAACASAAFFEIYEQFRRERGF